MLRARPATRRGNGAANSGCTAEEIKAITGHKSLSQVARYTRHADQQKLTRQALAKLRAAREQNTSENLFNQQTRLDKTGSKSL